MIDTVIVLFNFFLFLVCCWLFFRRYANQMLHEMRDERSRHKRLVEHRAGLRKQVAAAHYAIGKQQVVCDDLSLKIARWKHFHDEQQEIALKEHNLLGEQARQRNGRQMRALAVREMEKQIVRQVIDEMRQDFKKQLHPYDAGVRYNDLCLRDLHRSKGLL